MLGVTNISYFTKFSHNESRNGHTGCMPNKVSSAEFMSSGNGPQKAKQTENKQLISEFK